MGGTIPSFIDHPQTMVIPLGIDCTLADVLRKTHLRQTAYPFDWIVTYRGQTNFLLFRPENPDLLFLHDHWPDAKEKYQRRIQRFQTTLKTAEAAAQSILFLRKTHSYHNHAEHSNMKDDIEDMRRLETYLLQTYPQLVFRIVIFATCTLCHANKKKIEETISPRISWINLAVNPESTSAEKNEAQKREKRAIENILLKILPSLRKVISSSS